MNIADTERLIAVMRQHGVTHFKSLEVEIQMNPSSTASDEKPVYPKEVYPHQVQEIASAPPLQAIPPVESGIPHHVNEVVNMLRLNDNDLLDKIIPDYTQQGPKE